MTESFKLQLENAELYLGREEKRKENMEDKYKIMFNKVNDNIESIKQKISSLKRNIGEKNNKKTSENKEGDYCIGCSKRIKQGKYCDECRIAVEKIRYQTSKEMWEKLPEEEKRRRMEKLSKSLLNGGLN